MHIPPSFDAAFRRQHEIASTIRGFAQPRLSILCQDRRWLFTDRIKSVDSALAKLQVGLVRDLSKMWDIYGATVVVPTRNEVQDAVDAIKTSYPAAESMRRQRGSASAFLYDDVHLRCKLTNTAPSQPAEVRERTFEIQVRTGLQFAWWRATHDQIYKGSEQDWRLQRVASQIRGNLELLDGLLANLGQGAGLLEAHSTDLDQRFDTISGWIGLWPEGGRPVDHQVFVECVGDLLDCGSIGLDDGENLLRSERGKELINDLQLTPVQAVTVLVVEQCGPDVLLKRGRQEGRPHRKKWLLVTSEMLDICPKLEKLPPDRLVTF